MSNKFIEDLEDVRQAIVAHSFEYANLKLQKMIIVGKQSAQQSVNPTAFGGSVGVAFLIGLIVGVLVMRFGGG